MANHRLEVDWHLTNRCNFFCDYCHPQIKRVLNIRDLNERHWQEYVEAFNRLKVPCHILMSGGEPFMFPDFLLLCGGLTENHTISINTNLTHSDVISFAERIDPKKVEGILAAIHIGEREKNALTLESYAEKYIALRSAGFNVTAAYVLYPPLLDRAQADIDRLKELGVDRIAGKVFKGVYLHARYPESYTEKERLIVRGLAGEYKMTGGYLDGTMSFLGRTCNAGAHSIKVDVNGNIQRCATVKQAIGSLFSDDLSLQNVAYPCTAGRVLVLSECMRNIE